MASSFFMPHFRDLNNLRHFHFITGNVKAYGASHKKVVVLADDSTVGTVLFALIGQKLVENLTVSFGVKTIADTLNKRSDNHRLCGGIRVKAIFARQSLPYLVLIDIQDFLDLPQFKGWTDLEFCEWMIVNIGVAAVPGSSFFKEEVNHLIRLHFAREESTIDEALSRLSKLTELLK